MPLPWLSLFFLLFFFFFSLMLFFSFSSSNFSSGVSVSMKPSSSRFFW